jgi:non-heme chloroperoxidase
MRRPLILSALFVALFLMRGANAQTPATLDTSPHTTQFVIVDKDVQLEVLDWGGAGPPLIFLAGLGNTAHVFDTFAPQFTRNHHVYGITRRGFGKSSAPPPTEENYAADRLGDDVLAVIDALKIDRPVLAGHSIAGEELSSIGSRYPEKVAGLIYLDAGQAYAYYDPAHWEGGLIVNANELRRKLDFLVLPEEVPQGLVGTVKNLSQGDLFSQFENEVQLTQNQFQSFPAAAIEAPMPPLTPAMQIASAIGKGERKYTHLEVPILAIFAWPSAPAPPLLAQASAFEGISSAHVVTLANADHYVFRSNPADVAREMNAFMDGLGKSAPAIAK